MITESSVTIKQSFQAISSPVVETSRNGVQMCSLMIKMPTLLISKFGGHHPLWTTPLALAATVWWETTGLHQFL
jgi:hypothetical protein